MEKLKILKMFPDVKTPERANPTDSGVDVYAYSIKRYYQNHGSNFERMFEGDQLKKFVEFGEIELASQDRVLIGLGFKGTVGPRYEIQVRPRSGLALKQGLTVLNTPGTIDADYRDEFGVIIINLSRQNQKIKLGERIAQLVVSEVVLTETEIVTELPLSDRGGGFGSTGKK